MKKPPVILHNYMEDVVEAFLDDILDETEGVCRCPKCRLDILAIALNKLPPRYVVTEKGMVYAKAAELELQFKADVIKDITKAVGAADCS